MVEKILTDAEMKRFYLWSIWSKPVLIYTFTSVILAVTLTTCYLMLTGKASMDNSSGVVIAIVSTVTPVLASIFLGKAYERSKGVREDEYIPSRSTSPEDSVLASVSSFPSSEPDDALAALRSIDMGELEKYVPKIADDHPQV